MKNNLIWNLRLTIPYFKMIPIIFFVLLLNNNSNCAHAKTVSNLRQIGVFNPKNALVDVFSIDNKIYALLGYRPNDTVSGFKLYKANLQYDIEDSLIFIENKLQTFISNVVVNDNNTISLAISHHNNLELSPQYFVLINLDKNLKILNTQNINYNKLNSDLFQFASLTKLSNNNVLLNVLLNKKFDSEYRGYNVYFKFSLQNGLIKILEDTSEMYDEWKPYRIFSTFNVLNSNDTITFLKVPNGYLNQGYSGGYILKQLNQNLDIVLNQRSSNPLLFNNDYLINNEFHTLFNFKNRIYFYGVFSKYTNMFNYNANIIKITRNDSLKVISNLNNNASVSYRDVSSNKAIVIDEKNNALYGVTTYSTRTDSNYFGITHFDANFNIVWNRFYKLPNTALYINGIIKSGKELIVYGWQLNYFDGLYRPLFLTITEDGWLTGVKEFVVKNEYNIKIFPNPAKNHFTLQSDIKIVEIRILDLQGKLVQTNKNYDNVNPIDVSNLQTGIYFVSIETINGTQTSKLVIE